MSEEQLKAFLEKVKADTNIQEKLKAAGSNEAAIEIAKEAGFAITAEDIQSMQSATVELSDEELEGASGGGKVIHPDGCVYDDLIRTLISAGNPLWLLTYRKTGFATMW